MTTHRTTNDPPLSADVLVIGAGMAGLAAARTLAEAGRSVLVLESQSRIGGRILTQRIGNEIIELGAEFVHGRPPELLALIAEAGLELTERSGSFVRYEHGRLIPSDGDDNDDDRDDLFHPLEQLEDLTGPDLSFADYLDRQHIPKDHPARSALIGYVEGFNAADHRLISAAALGLQQKAEQELEGDRAFHLTGGYDQLPAYLAQRTEQHGGALRTDTRVSRIHWQPGRVEAITNQGSFTARQAVVTLPLAVLQSARVAFDPAPGDVLEHARRLHMGQACRLTLHLRERFLTRLPPQPALAQLSFLFTRDKLPSVWWTVHPTPSNTFTGWVGGPRSSALLGLSAEEIGRRACDTLAEVFHLDPGYVRDQMLGCYTHNWQADPDALGAYSYVGTGGLDAPQRMSEPVADTLYFAGEHTDTAGQWGTVHAALGSGLRTARQILAAKL
ncbi:MAG TPA: NAD(P)/FAD-dependent oxidoreductase [Granulicella sp.]|jgi:monoamine oxidase|nr:NAD(P)/FAD-dependent oxidoreductase [Granulicella sp.]